MFLLLYIANEFLAWTSLCYISNSLCDVDVSAEQIHSVCSQSVEVKRLIENKKHFYGQKWVSF